MQYILAVQTGGGGMGWLGIAPLVLIFAIFYFLLILPQQRRQKKWQEMLSQLKAGDKVTTSGGLRGNQHLAFPDAPMSNLLLTMLSKLGIPQPEFGDSTGPLAELDV